MIINLLYVELNILDTNNMWFQHYGPICHIALAKLDILEKQIDGMVISHEMLSTY